MKLECAEDATLLAPRVSRMGAYARVERGPGRISISQQGARSCAVGVELEVVVLERSVTRRQGSGDLVGRGSLRHGGDNRGGHFFRWC